MNEEKLFISLTGNEWLDKAKLTPIPKTLFGKLWFEGEICILFADTNLGKSILAVQIADSITKGVPISPCGLEAETQKVIYFDFELNMKQFENRYSIDYQEHYNFNKNFIRSELNQDFYKLQNYENEISTEIARLINQTNARILIIDNITYLSNELERAKDASPLMKKLKALKNQYNLSILVLAHTPKRDLAKPLTRNDLMGSKMLMNFCDSSFAIGESTSNKNYRYIKQIKQRNTEQIYDASNVLLFEITKDYNFLCFQFIKFDKEFNHLAEKAESEGNAEKIQRAQELKKEGYNQREIAELLDVGLGTINKWLQKGRE